MRDNCLVIMKETVFAVAAMLGMALSAAEAEALVAKLAKALALDSATTVKEVCDCLRQHLQALAQFRVDSFQSPPNILWNPQFQPSK